MSERCLAIVGPGTVGTAVGIAAARAGWAVAAVGGRDSERAAQAAQAIGPDVRACSLAEAAGAADVVLLTVSDDAIETLCRELAGSFRQGAVVAHCSGALDSSVLAAAHKKRRCRVASMHPLQTFPSVAAAVDKLAGTYFFCEGSEETLAVLEPLVADLDGRAVRLTGGAKAKALYHAAAVMACNYLTMEVDRTMQNLSVDLSAETTREILIPLLRTTVQNVAATRECEAGEAVIARTVQAFQRNENVPIFVGPETSCCNNVFMLQTAIWLLLYGAAQLMGRAGVERGAAIEALMPLVRATVENIAAVGPAAALTGPIARGDVETIKRHLAALKGDENEPLYRVLGRQTAGLALRKGSIDDKTARKLKRLMRPRRSDP